MSSQKNLKGVQHWSHVVLCVVNVVIVMFQSIVHCHRHVLPSSPQDILSMSHHYCRISPSCPFLAIECSQFISSVEYGLGFCVTIEFVETWLFITIVSCLQGKFVASLSPHTKFVTSLSLATLCWNLVLLLKNRSPQTSKFRSFLLLLLLLLQILTFFFLLACIAKRFTLKSFPYVVTFYVWIGATNRYSIFPQMTFDFDIFRAA